MGSLINAPQVYFTIVNLQFTNVNLLLPCSSVEDVKVGVSHGGPEGLVRQIGWPPCQSCHPPLKVPCGRVPPSARVSVEGALGPDQ